VFRPFARRQLSIAAGAFVDGVSTREIVIGFTDRPRGYLWSFPRPGHLAVGTCAQATETTAGEMHRTTDRWLDRYALAGDRPRRRYSWPIPSLEARDVDAERPAGDGWMLLGDATGLVDPVTREGIFFALRSGILAAEALTRRSPAREYEDAVRDELHDELRRAARLKAGFFRPRFTSLMIDALSGTPAIQEVMVDLVAGRQPYAGLRRRLLGTLELGLLMRMLFSRDPPVGGEPAA
jgi:flavin-dependent dehydrogenase